MPRSMTAFARITQDLDWGCISCELRSVNHRFLEISFKLPEPLREIELSLREIMRKRLTRGKIDCIFQVSYDSAISNFDIDADLAKYYINAAEMLASQMKNPAPLSALELIRWPGILKDPKSQHQTLQTAAKNILSETTSQLIECRQREGEKLCTLIQQKLFNIRSQVTLVRAERPKILKLQHQRLKTRLLQFVQELNADRVEQEMALIVNRSDVEEELDRIETHVSEAERVLLTSDAIGRRLDFLMQELNREANTLGSKSISELTTAVSVELKVLIEQIREQIQNIE